LQYNPEKPEMGPRWLGQLIMKRTKVQGFVAFDDAQLFSEGLKPQWLNEGKLKYRGDIVQGIENAPRAWNAPGTQQREATGSDSVNRPAKNEES
jgi:hypothetical protein